MWRRAGLPAPNDWRATEHLAVVIPARNEADRLPLLLRSLAAQQHPADQIVVVDDRSSDRTAEVARGFPGVQVLAAPDLPAGWTGKCWACHTGALATDSDVLVFLDADVQLDANALGSARTALAREGGLVSVQPDHHVQRPVESLSLLFNVVAVMGLGFGSLLPARHGWAAAGPLMITTRRDYDRAGGHRAVRAEVAEDLALAQRYRAADLPVRCFAGADQVRFRMYRDLRGLLEGWGKNLATGARRAPLLRSAGAALWITSLLVALGTIAGLLTAPTAPLVATALAIYAAVALQVAVLGARVGRFGPAALAWPLLVGVFVAVFAVSAINTYVRRKVRWSGRTLRIGVPSDASEAAETSGHVISEQHDDAAHAAHARGSRAAR